MDSMSQQIQEAVSSAFQTTVQRAKSNSKSFEQPTPRIFHSCVCHKAYIFIYGGLSLNPNQEFTNEHMFVYRYEIHRFEWKKIQTNFPNNLGVLNPLQNIYSHSCVVHGNVMYLFGGKSGKNGQCMNELWAMNLQSFNWRKQDQKGIVPAKRQFFHQKRQSASFVLANKSNLFLYGGKNEDFVFNDIHIYKIESKQWYNVETNNSEFLISRRLRPGICVVNDVIYVFGGERESSVEENTEILDDFYQIKIVQKATSVKPDVWIKKISSILKPGQLAGARLFNINDKHVGLLGGSISGEIESKNKLWMYDPQRVKWMYSNVEDPNTYSLGLGFNAIFQYDRVYISGGLKSDFTPLGSLYSIYIDSNDVPVNQFQSQERERLCMLCQEEKGSLCRKKLDGFVLFQESLKEMHFPFNAFGLLVDNSNLIKSTQINISCCHSNKQKYLLIQDDGYCETIWSNEDEFIEDMLKFRTISEQEMEVEGDDSLEGQIENIDQGNMEIEIEEKDKKVEGKEQPLLGSAKKEEDKEEEKRLKKKKQLAKRNKARKIRRRKEFSVNIKLGAMRLAKKMIYISENPDGSRRIFFMQELKIVSVDEEQQSSNQLKFQCHYYLLPSPTSTSPVHSHHSSQVSRQYLESEYKNFLKPILQQQPPSQFRNHMILLNLRQSVSQENTREPELKINTKQNDIYFGTSKLISKAQSLNIMIQDCVDISLKSYLSMLYLKGEYAKVALATQPQKMQEITNSFYFQKIDTLVKSTAIMDLQAAFDLEECKIVELYYYKNLLDTGKKPSKVDKLQRGSSKDIHHSSTLNAFLNGILIYHRNRLIKRYEYPFGSLLKYSELKKITTKNYNPLKIFGFIQLDEVFYSNILKTSFVNEENLANMYARIKFVEEYLESKSSGLSEKLVGKRSHKKTEGEIDGQIDSRKKLKGNQ